MTIMTAIPDSAGRALRFGAAALLAATTLAGCYNVEALTQAKIAESARLRLEDVDLGVYRITLPGRDIANGGGVVQFHAFGQVANRDLEEVQKGIERDRAEVRNSMLVAVRGLTFSELQDPDLKTLRTCIADVMNESLEGQPVKSVGFYDLRFNML